MTQEEMRQSTAVWMVCVEGSGDYSHIYSIHIDKEEAHGVCRKLQHQFPDAYVTAPVVMSTDLPVPNDGDSFWFVYEDHDGGWSAMSLAEWRADDGFEEDVDYGEALRREIADGDVISAASQEDAEKFAAERGIDLEDTP